MPPAKRARLGALYDAAIRREFYRWRAARAKQLWPGPLPQDNVLLNSQPQQAWLAAATAALRAAGRHSAKLAVQLQGLSELAWRCAGKRRARGKQPEGRRADLPQLALRAAKEALAREEAGLERKSLCLPLTLSTVTPLKCSLREEEAAPSDVNNQAAEEAVEAPEASRRRARRQFKAVVFS